MKWKVKAKVIRIPLSEVAREALANVDDAPDLDPSDITELPIIVNEGGKYSIVDGFHRIAGMAGWAESEARPTKGVKIDVIDISGSDEDVIGCAAEPGGRGRFRPLSQDEAIALIAEAIGG